MVDFSIIVVSYHSGPDLVSLIASLDGAADGATWHLTIVNNAADEQLNEVLAGDASVSIVEARGNLGYSGGINVGMAVAPASRWTVFLNPDLTLHTSALRILGEELVHCAAAVPLIVDDQGHRQNSLRREPTLLRAMGEAAFGNAWKTRPAAISETVRRDDEYTYRHSVDWATGAALAVDTALAETVGAWDSRRFFMYSEETDYARRIRSEGGEIHFVPDAVVTHRAGGSGTSPELDALLEVNKLRYYRKWHGTFPSAAFGLVQLVRNAVRPHRAGARLAVRAFLSPGVRAALPGGPR